MRRTEGARWTRFGSGPDAASPLRRAVGGGGTGCPSRRRLDEAPAARRARSAIVRRRGPTASPTSYRRSRSSPLSACPSRGRVVAREPGVRASARGGRAEAHGQPVERRRRVDVEPVLGDASRVARRSLSTTPAFGNAIGFTGCRGLSGRRAASLAPRLGRCAVGELGSTTRSPPSCSRSRSTSSPRSWNPFVDAHLAELGGNEHGGAVEVDAVVA